MWTGGVSGGLGDEVPRRPFGTTPTHAASMLITTILAEQVHALHRPKPHLSRCACSDCNPATFANCLTRCDYSVRTTTVPATKARRRRPQRQRSSSMRNGGSMEEAPACTTQTTLMLMRSSTCSSGGCREG